MPSTAIDPFCEASQAQAWIPFRSLRAFIELGFPENTDEVMQHLYHSQGYDFDRVNSLVKRQREEDDLYTTNIQQLYTKYKPPCYVDPTNENYKRATEAKAAEDKRHEQQHEALTQELTAMKDMQHAETAISFLTDALTPPRATSKKTSDGKSSFRH